MHFFPDDEEPSSSPELELDGFEVPVSPSSSDVDELDDDEAASVENSLLLLLL